MNTERTALLLSGPQHFDKRRPITGRLRRYAEHIDPLGIAIVSTYLKQAGFNVIWRQINPEKIGQLEGIIENVDGVFISSRHFDTDLATEIIGLANKYRRPSVVGGYGPTFNSEAFKSASAIVKGEFEPVAVGVVDDFASGKLLPEYDSTNLTPWDINNHYVWPDRMIFTQTTGVLDRLKRIPQEWQRGCTNYCSFCSPTRMQRGIIGRETKTMRVRERKLSDIISELEAVGLDKGGYLFSTDLNTSVISKDTLESLFKYLKNHNVKWFTEGTTTPILEDLEKNGWEKSLLRLMSSLDGKGGCYSFLYGIDDLVSKKVAGSFDKNVGDLRKAVEEFRKAGVPLNLSVVVGLDNHEYPNSLFVIRKILEEVRSPYAFLHLATPYLGTPWGERVRKEGRLDNDVSSQDYNHRRVVYRPLRMAPEELQQGYYWLLKTVDSINNITQTSVKNFDLRLFQTDPLLGIIGLGLPWSIETNLAVKELEARGFINSRLHSKLESGYKSWLRDNCKIE